jgi:uncharacterized DUF497 family protein
LYYNVIHHHTQRKRGRKTAEIYYLEWDDDNEEHLAGHGISAAEVRQMLGNRHLTMSNDRAEGRITLIGQTNGGKVLAIALDPTDDPGTWRPVTGLPASPAERRLFNHHCR